MADKLKPLIAQQRLIVLQIGNAQIGALAQTLRKHEPVMIQKIVMLLLVSRS
jgi:hypothetical protein